LAALADSWGEGKSERAKNKIGEEKTDLTPPIQPPLPHPGDVENVA